ncbi:MAG: hypothetical protein Q8R12_03045 [bacterium]|nr:hypothetical protein [bacterium]
MKPLLQFFDKLEDKIRKSLSRQPILYTFIGGTAIVLFWRGVWLTADLFPFLSGPVSTIISVLVLLVTGLFVSFFIGDEIIIKALRQEKKISEETEEEIKTEEITLKHVKGDLEQIKEKLDKLLNK